MKKYVKPMMEGQMFVSNEFVGACYKIRCTTPVRNSTFYYVYDDTNGNGSLDENDKQLYHSTFGFTGCGGWHVGVIRDDAPEANGFVTTRKYNSSSNTVHAIHYWYENLGASADIHVMTPGAENYETNPNAS